MNLDGIAAYVPDEFKRLVSLELSDARHRALTVLGRAKRRYRNTPGRCCNCGVPWATKTPGCVNCTARHDMRARKAA